MKKFCESWWVAVILMILSTTFSKISMGANVFDDSQVKMVKIYGAGGFAQLEEYQSGFFVSAEGHILTAFQPALDTDNLVCVTSDGKKFDAKMCGVDPILEIAVLKIDKEGVPFFNLAEFAAFTRENGGYGENVWAFSNLFNVAVGNEQVSVQKCRIACLTTMAAARGVYKSRYQGEVYILDVSTNNPGAAGGALVSSDGEKLYGILGKELRHAKTGCWLNFALPTHVVEESVSKIIQGEDSEVEKYASENQKLQNPMTEKNLGLVFVPEILPKTPPYVDFVQKNARAETGGIRTDDLILYVNQNLVSSIEEVRSELEILEAESPVCITVLRDEEILELEL